MPDFSARITRHLEARGVDHTRHFSVVEELARHLDDRYESLLARGMTPAAAEATVLQELADNNEIVRELRYAERTAGPAAPAPGSRTGTRLEGWGRVTSAV